MELEECTPLELPFVDNQVDFAFYFECVACDKTATLAQIEQRVVSTEPATQSSTTTSTTTVTLPDVVDLGPPPVIAPTADGFAFAANTCDELDAAFRPTDAQAVQAVADTACRMVLGSDAQPAAQAARPPIETASIHNHHTALDGLSPQAGVGRYVWCRAAPRQRAIFETGNADILGRVELHRIRSPTISIISVLHCKARDPYRLTALAGEGVAVVAFNSSAPLDSAPDAQVTFPQQFAAAPVLSVGVAGLCGDDAAPAPQTVSADGFTLPVRELECAFKACFDTQACHVVIHWRASTFRVAGVVSPLAAPAGTTAVGYLSGAPRRLSFHHQTPHQGGTTGGGGVVAHAQLSAAAGTSAAPFAVEIGIQAAGNGPVASKAWLIPPWATSWASAGALRSPALPVPGGSAPPIAADGRSHARVDVVITAGQDGAAGPLVWMGADRGAMPELIATSRGSTPLPSQLWLCETLDGTCRAPTDAHCQLTPVGHCVQLSPRTLPGLASALRAPRAWNATEAGAAAGAAAAPRDAYVKIARVGEHHYVRVYDDVGSCARAKAADVVRQGARKMELGACTAPMAGSRELAALLGLEPGTAAAGREQFATSGMIAPPAFRLLPRCSAGTAARCHRVDPAQPLEVSINDDDAYRIGRATADNYKTMGFFWKLGPPRLEAAVPGRTSFMRYFKKQVLEVAVGAPGRYHLLVQYPCASSLSGGPVIVVDILAAEPQLRRKPEKAFRACRYTQDHEWGVVTTFTVAAADSAHGSVWAIMETRAGSSGVTRIVAMDASVLAPSPAVFAGHPFFAEDATAGPGPLPCNFYGSADACKAAGCVHSAAGGRCSAAASAEAFAAVVRASAAAAGGPTVPEAGIPASPCDGLSPLGCSFRPTCQLAFDGAQPKCVANTPDVRQCSCAEVPPTNGATLDPLPLVSEADWCSKESGCEIKGETTFSEVFNSTVEVELCTKVSGPATVPLCKARLAKMPALEWNRGTIHAGCFLDVEDDPFAALTGRSSHTCFAGTNNACSGWKPSQGDSTLPKRVCPALAYCPAVTVASSASGGGGGHAGRYLLEKNAATVAEPGVVSWRKVTAGATGAAAPGEVLRVFTTASGPAAAVLLREDAAPDAQTLARYTRGVATMADVALLPNALAISAAEITQVKVSTGANTEAAYGALGAKQWLSLTNPLQSLAGLSVRCICPMPQSFSIVDHTLSTATVVLAFPQSLRLLLATSSRYSILYRRRSDAGGAAEAQSVSVDVAKAVPVAFTQTDSDDGSAIVYQAELPLPAPLEGGARYDFWVDANGDEIARLASACVPMGAPDALAVTVEVGAAGTAAGESPGAPDGELGAITTTSATFQTKGGRRYIAVAWTAACDALPDLLFDVRLEPLGTLVTVSAANARAVVQPPGGPRKFEYAAQVSVLAAKGYTASVRYHFASPKAASLSGDSPAVAVAVTGPGVMAWARVDAEVQSAGFTDAVLAWTWHGAGESTPQPDGFVIFGACLSTCSSVHVGSTRFKQVVAASGGGGGGGGASTATVAGLRPDSTYSFSVVPYTKMGGAAPCIERIAMEYVPPGAVDCLEGDGPVIYGSGAAATAATQYAAPDYVYHAPTIVGINVTAPRLSSDVAVTVSVAPIEECSRYVFEVTTESDASRAKFSSSVATPLAGGTFEHTLSRDLFVPGASNRVRVYAMTELDHLGMPSDYAVLKVPPTMAKRAAPPVAVAVTDVTATGFSVRVHDYDGGARHKLVVEGPLDAGGACCMPASTTAESLQPDAGAQPACSLAFAREPKDLQDAPPCPAPGEASGAGVPVLPACVSCERVFVPSPAWGWGGAVHIDGLEPHRVYAVSMWSNQAEVKGLRALFARLADAPSASAGSESGDVTTATLFVICTVLVLLGTVLTFFVHRHFSRVRARTATPAGQSATVYEAGAVQDPQAEEKQQINALKKKATSLFNQHCNTLNEEASFHRVVDLTQLERPRSTWTESGDILKGTASRIRDSGQQQGSLGGRGEVRVHEATDLSAAVSSSSSAAPVPAARWVVIRSMSAGKVSDELVAQALCEALLVSRLKHDNVAQLYAVTTAAFPLCVVSEWMKKGSLKQFLQKGDPAKTSGAEEPHSAADLNDFAVQVACGMEYLSQNKVVVKTLQARGIHVTEEHVIKISGFQGACTDPSRVLKTSEGTWANCVRWMAPEVLCQPHEFTELSDVWAFGVVMWEIYSYGQAPYATDSNQAVVRRSTGGDIIFLTPPAACTGTFEATMKRCWLEEPEERKPFKELHKWLRAELNNSRTWDDNEGGATSGYVDVQKIKDQNAQKPDLNALYGTGAK